LAQPIAHAVALAAAWSFRAAAASARCEFEAARSLWSVAQQQYESMDIPNQALDARVELAGLEWQEGHLDVAVAEVLGVLRAGQADLSTSAGTEPAPDPWPLVGPQSLWRCQVILAAAGHGRADGLRNELLRRLQAQLSQLPDEAARQRLVQAVPHWRETARLSAA
jgi:hypothetical protein